MAATIEYIYCVVPSSFELRRGITGIDETQVHLIVYRDLAALVSTLDGQRYRSDLVEQMVGDIEWLKPHAVAHDRVVTWASDRIPTVPMLMWAMMSDEAGVRAALRDRYDLLCANLDTLSGAREYTVRVFAKPDALAASAASLSPRLAELERDVASANPGQAYLLRRKLDAERKTETRAIARQIAEGTYATLARYTKQSTRDPLPQGESEGNAILNASFLVETAQYDNFREALTELVTHYQSNGIHFDFTGPWPAYHFVRER